VVNKDFHNTYVPPVAVWNNKCNFHTNMQVIYWCELALGRCSAWMFVCV